MKKRNIMILVLLLIIGFAAIATSFFINGKMNLAKNDQDFSIYFSEAILDNEDHSNDFIVDNKKRIIFESSELSLVKDTSILDYEVTNASRNYDAKVEIVCTPMFHEYFSLKNEFAEEIIKAGTKEKGRILIEMTKASIIEQRVPIECILNFDVIERDDLGSVIVDENKHYQISGFFLDENKNIVPNALIAVIINGEIKVFQSDDYGYIYIEGLEKGSNELYYVVGKSKNEIEKLTKEQLEEIKESSAKTNTNGKEAKFDNGYEIGEFSQKEVIHNKFNAVLTAEDEEDETIELYTDTLYKLPVKEKEGYIFEWYEGDKLITANTFITKATETIEGRYRKIQSINDALMNPALKSGVQDLTMYINDTIVKYPARVYVYEGDQTWGNTTFGESGDIGTASTNAKYMEVVKVKGDLTINAGATITTVGSAYGGPKGFSLYVEGTLTNNGTISMSQRGAKAVGENVYLYKNEDGSYEYVPAVGGSGGAGVTARVTSCTRANTPGQAGRSSTIKRGLGGGGSGATATYRCTSGSVVSRDGAAATSYSGGSGSGAVSIGMWPNSTTYYGGYPAGNGGAGGAATAYNQGSGPGTATGGAGNPGGNGANQWNATAAYKGLDGTGGLLNIFAKNVYNNSNFQAIGNRGGNSSNPTQDDGGGSSGGGSINVFYKKELKQGTTNVSGGVSYRKGGAGGNGSVTFTKI